jgi:hypothetical protein
MPKLFSLNYIAHRYGARLPICAYVLLGIALVPIISLPEMDSIENVTIRECHKSCHTENGYKFCTYKCSQKSTSSSPVTKAYIPTRTGPTVPPKPVGTRH